MPLPLRNFLDTAQTWSSFKDWLLRLYDHTAEFNLRYYGPLAADPTLNPLGGAIIDGDMYFRTTSPVGIMVYRSGFWVNYEASAYSSAISSAADAAIATEKAAVAVSQANAAGLAKTAAESARDAAIATGKLYPNTGAGVAPDTGVVVGGYFLVPGLDGRSALLLWRNVAGVATAILDSNGVQVGIPAAAILSYLSLQDWLNTGEAGIDSFKRMVYRSQSDGSFMVSKLRNADNVDVYGLIDACAASIAVNAANIAAIGSPTAAAATFKAALPNGYFPGVMASPPTLTMTQSSVTTIAGAVLTAYNSAIWRFMHATPLQVGSNSFMGGRSAFYGGVTYGTNSFCVEWQHTGTSFEIRMRASLGSFRLLCGVGAGAAKKDFASAVVTSLPADGNNYVWKVTFPTSATREFRLEGNGGLQWGGVYVAPGESVAAPGTPVPPIVVMPGDSFVEGAGTQTPGAQLSVVMGRALGWDIRSAGVGSTGVNNPGGLNTAGVAKVNYQDATRILDVTGVANVKAIAIWQSLNDSGYTQQQQFDGLNNLITAYRAVLPLVPIIIIGPTWPYGTPVAGLYGIRDAGAAAAAARGCLFVDSLTPSRRTGTGHEVYPAPTLTAISSTGTSGGPAAGTYYYTATFKDALGETVASNELSITTTGGPIVVTRAAANSNYIGMASWTLYRGTVSGTTGARVANAISLASLTSTDTGAATTAASPPLTNTTGLKNDGTADLYTCPDGTHPSALGGEFDGLMLARQIKQLVLTQF